MEEDNQQTAETSTETSSKPKLGLIAGILILAVIGVGAYFIFGTNKNSSAAPVINSTVKTFTVDGSSYTYNPSTITANKGDAVKIIFKDTDSRHDLVIDGYNLRTDVIGPGKTDTIEFVADKVGTFEYYCSLPGHKAQGMTGKLVVI